ncbi:MAG TPA: CHAT domain-containing protein [Chloroflexaceae bacterium]|nr:CHAT domain-containing protein [Chloroflexaceae bacterium]
MDYVELELGIFRSDEGYAVEMRFRAGETATDLVLTRNTPITLDLAGLFAVEHDKRAYGRRLAAALFGQRKLLDGWRYARTYSTSFDLLLRVHLRLDPTAPGLHQICWEALCDPDSGEQLGLSEHVVLLRSLDHYTFAPLRLPQRSALRALAVVASPEGLEEFALAPLDVAGEVERLRSAMGDMDLTCIGGHEGRPRATFSAMVEALAEGVHILYLVCHRTIVDGEAYLWFEDDEGGWVRIAERAVAERIAGLRRPPLLVVAVGCGSGSSMEALGPLLARAGIGAVVAMNGDTPVELVRQLLPTFFRALARSGQIDHALSVARAAVSLGQPWWMPVLWLRVRDGRLWTADAPAAHGEPPERRGASRRSGPRAIAASW